MLLFGAAEFSNDGRGLKQALTEALAEVGQLKASLQAAHQREAALRSRCEQLERSRAASFALLARR